MWVCMRMHMCMSATHAMLRTACRAQTTVLGRDVFIVKCKVHKFYDYASRWQKNAVWQLVEIEPAFRRQPNVEAMQWLGWEDAKVEEFSPDVHELTYMYLDGDM